MSYAERFTQTHKLNFLDAARLAADHNTSFLRPLVMEQACEGEMSAPVLYYDSGKAQRREGRAPANRDTPASRRRRWLAYNATFDSGEYIDSNDKFQGMTNFQSPLMMHHAANVQRFIDEDVILSGYFGDAFEGKVGGTAIPFPAGNTIGITVQKGAGVAQVGMNLEKIKRGRKTLAVRKFDLTREEAYCIVTAGQVDNLSNELELTSRDYREEANPTIDQATGKIAKIWNITLVEYQNLPTKLVGGNLTQRNPLFLKSCMMLGVWKDIMSDAWPDPSKFNELYMNTCANMDARRLDEQGCLEIESLIT